MAAISPLRDLFGSVGLCRQPSLGIQRAKGAQRILSLKQTFRIDGFVKSPILSVTLHPSSLRRTLSTPHSSQIRKP